MEALIEHSRTDIIESAEARDSFIHRAAKSLDKALGERLVNFTAVNQEVAVGEQEFDCVAQLALFHSKAGWTSSASASLTLDSSFRQENPIPSLVTLSDSELKRIVDPWADVIRRQAQHIVFANLYCPKAVEYGGRYNDLRVAFRIVRAWDSVRSIFVVRFDSVFKNLAL